MFCVTVAVGEWEGEFGVGDARAQQPTAGDQSEMGPRRAPGDGRTHQRLQPHLTLCSFPLPEEELHNPYVSERLLGLHALAWGKPLACYLTPASRSVSMGCCEQRGDSRSKGEGGWDLGDHQVKYFPNPAVTGIA